MSAEKVLEKDYLWQAFQLARTAYQHPAQLQQDSNTVLSKVPGDNFVVDRSWTAVPLGHQGIYVDPQSFQVVGGKATPQAAQVLRGAWGLPPEGDVCVLGFRGTDNAGHLENWLSDADFFPTRVPDYYNCTGCKVHRGFLEAVEHFQAPDPRGDRDPMTLMEHLSNVKCDASTPTLITGHSLGGALAQIATVALKEKYGLNVQGLVHFESPTVGDGAFNSHLSSIVPPVQVTNGLDPVPQLFPDASMTSIAFPPNGTQVYYSEKDKVICPPTMNPQTCALHLQPEPKDCQVPCGIRQHNGVEAWKVGDHCLYQGPDFGGLDICAPSPAVKMKGDIAQSVLDAFKHAL